ncbi:DUF1571 domain-containing protein [Pandoraea horticolens]
MRRAALAFALLPVALVAGALSTRDAVAQTNTLTGASTPATPGANATSNAASPADVDVDVSRLAALPVAAQAQWLSHAIKSGELAKLSDDEIVARMQALQADALVRFLKAESAALPEYQYELTRHERINNQWQTTPDRVLVKIREKPLQIYAKWLPDGAHSGQEIIYDETKRPKETYGHLGGILGFAFIAEQIAHDGRSFRAAGLPEKPARISVSEANGVRMVALEWDASSGPPQHYANKSRVLIDLKTGRPRGIEAWDATGQKVEEMRFEKVRKQQWTDATFDPKSPDYKF